MLFVIDKIRFQKFIAIVRKDRKASQWGTDSPYLRIQAEKDLVEIAGGETAASLKATVYEPGVLFIRTTLFRRVLKATPTDQPFMTFQVDKEALVFADVKMPFETNDMVLYTNPAEAPQTWPSPPPPAEQLPKVQPLKALYRHKTNGRIYAIETNEYGNVVATAGPLLFKDLNPEELSFDKHWNTDVKLNFTDYVPISAIEYSELLKKNGFMIQQSQRSLLEELDQNDRDKKIKEKCCTKKLNILIAEHRQKAGEV